MNKTMTRATTVSSRFLGGCSCAVLRLSETKKAEYQEMAQQQKQEHLSCKGSRRHPGTRSHGTSCNPSIHGYTATIPFQPKLGGSCMLLRLRPQVMVCLFQVPANSHKHQGQGGFAPHQAAGGFFGCSGSHFKQQMTINIHQVVNAL